MSSCLHTEALTLQPDNNGKETTNQSGESCPAPATQTVAETCVKLEAFPQCVSPGNQLQQGSAPAPTHHPNQQARLHPQEEESHEMHHFKWCCPGMKTLTLTCNQPGTIEETLMRSSMFRTIAKKNKNKERFILREGRLLGSHFPCCLIKSEHLIVKYSMTTNKHKQPVQASVHPQRKAPSGKLVVFNLLTKGGKNLANITKDPVLKNDFQEMSFYGYKGEKVRRALKRDGRLLESVFKKSCALIHTKDEEITEMSGLVDNLDSKTFQLVLCKSSPEESLPSSLEDYIVENESGQNSDSQISGMSGSRVLPQLPPTTESVNISAPKEKPTQTHHTVSESMWREMQNSNTMQKRLSEQFDRLVKEKRTQQGSRRSPIQNLFSAEFGKNDRTCREVRTYKKLSELSNSVCQVRINGSGAGTGFLLFGRFVLTNGHVVRTVFNGGMQLNGMVTVHFSFESLDQAAAGVCVEEVAGYELFQDEQGNCYDWALLKLRADLNLPDALLRHFGFLPHSGGICLIGHPEGGVKLVDPCLIIPTEARQQVVERQRHENPDGVVVDDSDYGGVGGCLHILTDQFFDRMANRVESKRQALMYESCFYHGSSGSPVFDEHCKVVAMHTGGHPYYRINGGKQSILEFGYPLSSIIEHIIIQLVERRRLDVLKEYLACPHAQSNALMRNVKEVVESRCNFVFKNALISSLDKAESDESLKMFFGFFVQKDETVPMEICSA